MSRHGGVYGGRAGGMDGRRHSYPGYGRRCQYLGRRPRHCHHSGRSYSDEESDYTDDEESDYADGEPECHRRRQVNYVGPAQYGGQRDRYGGPEQVGGQRGGYGRPPQYRGQQGRDAPGYCDVNCWLATELARRRRNGEERAARLQAMEAQIQARRQRLDELRIQDAQDGHGRQEDNAAEEDDIPPMPEGWGVDDGRYTPDQLARMAETTRRFRAMGQPEW